MTTNRHADRLIHQLTDHEADHCARKWSFGFVLAVVCLLAGLSWCLAPAPASAQWTPYRGGMGPTMAMDSPDPQNSYAYVTGAAWRGSELLVRVRASPNAAALRTGLWCEVRPGVSILQAVAERGELPVESDVTARAFRLPMRADSRMPCRVAVAWRADRWTGGIVGDAPHATMAKSAFLDTAIAQLYGSLPFKVRCDPIAGCFAAPAGLQVCYLPREVCGSHACAAGECLAAWHPPAPYPPDCRQQLPGPAWAQEIYCPGEVRQQVTYTDWCSRLRAMPCGQGVPAAQCAAVQNEACQ